MALPQQLKSARLSDSSIANTIDNEVGNIEKALADILGFTIDADVTESPTLFDNTGRFTKALLRQAAAGPVGWRIRNTTNGKEFRLVLNGTNIDIDENTGTEGTPGWANRWRMDIATGAITAAGAITLPADPTAALQAATKQYIDAKTHASLVGLGLDDHTQYHTDARGDARYPLRTLLTTKGDLYVRDATGIIRLAAGADGLFLKADSAQASGLAWGTPAETVSVIDRKGVNVTVTGAAEQTLWSPTIPGGTLGTEDAIQLIAYYKNTSPSNDHTLRIKYGGTVIYSEILTPGIEGGIILLLQGNNSTTAQQAKKLAPEAANASTSAVDSAVNQALALTAQGTDINGNFTLYGAIILKMKL